MNVTKVTERKMVMCVPLQIAKPTLDWVYSHAKAMRKCEFLALMGAAPPFDTISLVVLLPCVKASIAHAQASGATVLEALDFIDGLDYRCMGMLHGHSSFGTFHSDTDDKSIFAWLPRIAAQNATYTGDLSPRVLGPKAALLPYPDGEALRFDLNTAGKGRWGHTEMTTLEASVPSTAKQMENSLVLQGGSVELRLKVPRGSTVSSSSERLPGVVGTAWSVVVNSASQHFIEAMVTVEAGDMTFLKKVPSKLEVVDFPHKESIVNRDFIAFATKPFQTAFGIRSGSTTHSFDGQEVNHE